MQLKNRTICSELHSLLRSEPTHLLQFHQSSHMEFWTRGWEKKAWEGHTSNMHAMAPAIAVNHLLIVAFIAQWYSQRTASLSPATMIQHMCYLDIAFTFVPKAKANAAFLKASRTNSWTEIPSPQPGDSSPVSQGKRDPHPTSASTSVRSAWSSRFVVTPSVRNRSIAGKWHPSALCLKRVDEISYPTCWCPLFKAVWIPRPVEITNHYISDCS